jgi:nickel/cobalt exporter
MFTTTEALAWLREGQHYFNDLVVTYLQTIKEENTFIAYVGLISVGFLYGAIHAVGPGHGKMVVSSYVLANENSLKRGLLVVGFSSLLQSITAITLVLGFYYVLAATRSQAEHWAALLETASFIMIGALGGWLILQGITTLAQAIGLYKKKHYSHDHHHGHDHHDHDHSCGSCGHAHVPTPDELKGKKNFASLAVMIVSIGIRPCTGALLLLFFSCMFDLAWPGILATLAMGLGTATTTGALAILAVKSKKLALSFVKKSDRGLLFTHAALRLGGGAVILLMAVLFLTMQIGGEALPNNAQHPLYKSLQ